MYFVDFSEKAKEDLNGFQHNIAEYIEKILRKELQDNPTNKGRYLGKSQLTRLTYWEKRFFAHGGFRAYYTISNGDVTIEMIIYDGKVIVDRVSNKKDQKKMLKRLGI